MTTTVVSAFSVATAVSISNHAGTIRAPRFKTALTVRAVVNGHAGLGMDSADAAAAIEIGAGAALGLNANFLSARVEVVGVPFRGNFRCASGRATCRLGIRSCCATCFVARFATRF